jgi:hypothetical protein
MNRLVDWLEFRNLDEVRPRVHGSSQLRGKRTCPLGVSTYFVRQDDACRLISEGQAPLAGLREKTRIP